MPGRSCGTAEVDELFTKLRSGVSRRRAGNDFKAKNVGEDYPRDLVRSMKKYSRRLFTLLLEADLPPVDCLSPSLMLLKPVTQLNHLSLVLGSNAVFCSRITILSYDLKRAGMGISLKTHSAARLKEILNSS
jgi:hypothetical protein